MGQGDDGLLPYLRAAASEWEEFITWVPGEYFHVTAKWEGRA
jgi:hypothetical protein